MTGFVIPKREIMQMAHMSKWLASKAYFDYTSVVTFLNEAVKRKPLNEVPEQQPEILGKCVVVLEELDKWIDEIPPIEQPQRYGNKAFRDWYKRLCERVDEQITGLLPDEFKPASMELAPYFQESFGNSTRIDYGSGHEASFVMFLTCLFNLNLLTNDDSASAVVNCLFARYLRLVRRLQIVYKMEPAGSHGVWSLDDYQFLPFLWGSAQLIDHPKLMPDSFINPNIAEQYADSYLFMGCIKFINSVKTGPFAEHSNQLWNISAVPSWSKVNVGLLKSISGHRSEKWFDERM